MRKLADTDGREAVATAESKGGVYHGITMEELNAKWNETVEELKEREITVTNAENALEGALSIRYSNQNKLYSSGHGLNYLLKAKSYCLQDYFVPVSALSHGTTVQIRLNFYM